MLQDLNEMARSVVEASKDSAMAALSEVCIVKLYNLCNRIQPSSCQEKGLQIDDEHGMVPMVMSGMSEGHDGVEQGLLTGPIQCQHEQSAKTSKTCLG